MIELSRVAGPRARQVLRENLARVSGNTLQAVAAEELGTIHAQVDVSADNAARIRAGGLESFTSQWLRHEDARIRKAGLAVLPRELEGAELLALLAPVVTGDADREVRTCAAEVLIVYVPVEDVEARANPGELFDNANELAATGMQASLLRILKVLDERFRFAAPTRWVEFVLCALDHPGPDVREAAAAALGRLASTDAGVMWELAQHLDRERDVDVAAALEKALRAAVD